MNRVIILQARMTSTRLPGKVLMQVAGQPMLARQLARLKRCQRADEIVVATTANDDDDPVVAVAQSAGVRWFRGPEQDVLGRYLGAAREARADLVVRITADCPLIDPEQSDRVIEAVDASKTPVDYASNIIRRTFPHGLDTEAFTKDALERLGELTHAASDREHVTTVIRRDRPQWCRIASVTDEEDNADLRWTVDVAEDLETIRRLYEALDLARRPLGYREIVRFVRSHPTMVANAAVVSSRTPG